MRGTDGGRGRGRIAGGLRVAAGGMDRRREVFCVQFSNPKPRDPLNLEPEARSPKPGKY